MTAFAAFVMTLRAAFRISRFRVLGMVKESILHGDDTKVGSIRQADIVAPKVSALPLFRGIMLVDPCLPEETRNGDVYKYVFIYPSTIFDALELAWRASVKRNYGLLADIDHEQ